MFESRSAAARVSRSSSTIRPRAWSTCAAVKAWEPEPMIVELELRDQGKLFKAADAGQAHRAQALHRQTRPGFAGDSELEVEPGRTATRDTSG